ncbi:unnamed protein product [Aphanomyces euteiches]
MSLIESTNITYLKAPPVDVPVVESAAAQVEAARASFDFYVLAQSWQPYFCTTGDFPGCDNPSDYMTTQLTIHGLWPNYNSGLYPADCGGRYPQGWRSVQVLAGCQDARLDVRVERMGKHGTCSGLTPSNYVSSTINLHKKVGQRHLWQRRSQQRPRSTIRAAYGTIYVSLICKGSNHVPQRRLEDSNCMFIVDSCGKQTSSKVSIYSFN